VIVIGKSDILKAIEQLRKELKELIEEKDGLLDKEVIKKSQELDKILNKYMRYLRDK